jgi:hypothetical protein
MATTTKERTTSSRANGSRSRGGEGSGGRSGSRARSGGRSANGGSTPDVKATNVSRDERRFLESNAARLSKSTLRAKWIHGDERPDRNGQTVATRDPDVIRRWAEARGAQPATVSRRDGEVRTLRFDFPAGGRAARLEPIEWEAWLSTFQDRDLVFLYQEKKRDGSDSNFFRLDNPKREDG